MEVVRFTVSTMIVVVFPFSYHLKFSKIDKGMRDMRMAL